MDRRATNSTYALRVEVGVSVQSDVARTEMQLMTYTRSVKEVGNGQSARSSGVLMKC